MRYIDVGSYYIPKHCIYGPRPVEGIILSDVEWLSITDHLVKDQREKAIAVVQTAKEDMKKNISLEMTKKWNNTMAGVNTWKEKKSEKIARENQERNNKYDEILKNRKEENKLVVQNMRQVRTENRDATKTINSGILYSVVLQEREKQIELKNSIKNQEKLKIVEEANRIKKELEELPLEEKHEEIKERMKKRKQKDFLDKQLGLIKGFLPFGRGKLNALSKRFFGKMKEIKQRRKEIDEEREREKQDLINMRIEEEKIQKCIEAEKKSRKELAARLNDLTQTRLEYQRNMLLEEEEEDEINKIYIRFQNKFEKARKEKEKKLLDEKIELRQKAADRIAIKLMEAQKKEEERISHAVNVKQQEGKEEEECKEELRRQRRQEMLDFMKKMEKTLAEKKYDDFNRKKWEMMQIYKTAEIDCKWKQDQRKKLNEAQARTRACYDNQIKEREKRRAEELRNRFGPEEGDLEEIQDVLQQCDEAIDFAKEYNTPLYPILVAIEKVKRNYGLLDKKPQQFNEACEREEEQKKLMRKNLRDKCICLTY